MLHALRISSQCHPGTRPRRSRLQLLCAAISVALLTVVAFGGSAPAATSSSQLSVSRMQDGQPAARGGKALTEEEFWRAQWRDEGAVFPGDRTPKPI